MSFKQVEILTWYMSSPALTGSLDIYGLIRRTTPYSYLVWQAARGAEVIPPWARKKKKLLKPLYWIYIKHRQKKQTMLDYSQEKQN